MICAATKELQPVRPPPTQSKLVTRLASSCSTTRKSSIPARDSCMSARLLPLALRVMTVVAIGQVPSICYSNFPATDSKSRSKSTRLRSAVATQVQTTTGAPGRRTASSGRFRRTFLRESISFALNTLACTKVTSARHSSTSSATSLRSRDPEEATPDPWLRFLESTRRTMPELLSTNVSRCDG